jgi:hypothetical protein
MMLRHLSLADEFSRGGPLRSNDRGRLDFINEGLDFPREQIDFSHERILRVLSA